MNNVYEASGSMFFKKTGELVTLGSDETPKDVFCYGGNVNEPIWYWYTSTGKCQKLGVFNIPRAVHMAVLLLTGL